MDEMVESLRYWPPWRRFLVVNAKRVKKWEWLYYKILNYLYPSDMMIHFK